MVIIVVRYLFVVTYNGAVQNKLKLNLKEGGHHGLT